MDTWEPTWPGRPPGSGSLGQRIAVLRVDRGWTQQQLADRLGISRVAVSHLETDINTPGERTVALLAGLFRTEPHDLVAGTSYPVAKADRLPTVVNRWTEVEHRLALFDRDVRWIQGDPTGSDPTTTTSSRGSITSGVSVGSTVVDRVLGEWDVVLAKLAATVVDRGEAAAVAEARRRLGDLRSAHRAR